MTYFFVVDGFNGAYGTWQFDLAALDNSSVEGSLLSTPYGLAVAGTSSTSTTSKTAFVTSFARDSTLQAFELQLSTQTSEARLHLDKCCAVYHYQNI